MKGSTNRDFLKNVVIVRKKGFCLKNCKGTCDSVFSAKVWHYDAFFQKNPQQVWSKKACANNV